MPPSSNSAVVALPDMVTGWLIANVSLTEKEALTEFAVQEFPQPSCTAI